MDVFYNNPLNKGVSNILLKIENGLNGYNVIELSKIASISSGKTPINRNIGRNTEFTVPLLRTSNIKKGEIIINDETTSYISNCYWC